MPTVPRYDSPQIQSQQSNIPRISDNVSTEAFGGGESAERRQRATQGAMDTVTQILKKELDNANQLAVLEADEKLSQLETSLLYDPERGAVNRHGKDAFGLHEQIGEAFAREVQNVESTLANNDQRVAFKRYALARQTDLDRVLQRHVSGEIQKHDAQVTQSYIKNEFEAAAANYQDLSRINESIDRQTKAIIQYGARNGIPSGPGSPIEEQVATAASKTHMAVMSRMLANGEDLAASRYYKLLKGHVEPSPEGLLQKGNIDLENRPRVLNDDLTTSTVESISIGVDNKEILIPTIREDGYKMSPQEAAAHFRKTGKHLGVFATKEAANQFGQTLHEAQEMALHGDLTAADAISIEKSLKEGTLRGETQRRTDEIMRKNLDRMSSLKLASKITDPKIREAVEQRVEHFINQKKQAEIETRNDLYLKTAKMLDQNPGLSPSDVRYRIPPDTLTQLTPEHVKALEARVSDPPNNNKAWMDFIDLGANQIAALSRTDFELRYWSKFDKSHRGQSEGIWISAKEAAAKGAPDPKLTATMNFHERVENTFRSMNGVRTDKPKAKWDEDETRNYMDFEDKASKRIENFELVQKRKAMGQEVQKILDELVREKVFLPGGFFTRGEEKPVIKLRKDEKNRSYLPVSMIPPAVIEKLRNKAEDNNKTMTTDQLQRAAALTYIGDDEGAYAVLNE